MNARPVHRAILTSLMALSLGLTAASAEDLPPRYRDASQPLARRVEDLLGRMTLEEKVGQMNMPCLYLRELGATVPERLENSRAFARGTLVPELGPGGGFFTLANNLLGGADRRAQAECFNELQRIAIEQTRLGIPLLQTEEGTHGLMCSGGTVFPEGPAIGSTWNLDLVRDLYAVVAREARSVGIHQLFTLVIEPIRDPRLGRNQEAYTEDPFLSARLAGAIVEGVQGEDVAAPDKTVAGLCHYPGQSEPVSGLERGAMEISERKLREVFLPPWVAGIKQSGALGVMATYPAVDGQPVHASRKLLTDILRGELGFEGLVLGEGHGISTIVWEQVAATQKEAGVMALNAGLDVGISWEEGFMGPLVESVREGKASMAMIDRAVSRILRQKFRLGLFERPYVDPDHAAAVGNTAQHRELALDVAREGIVLLKNAGDLLPLAKDRLKSIAVIGPNADHARNQLGDYIANHLTQEVVTVLEGIRRKVPGVRVEYVKGCNVLGDELDEFAQAQAVARKADVAIVVVGENERKAANNQGTNGEGRDVTRLELTGRQEELIRAVHATGTPTVVVLINGRPISIPWLETHVSALLEAWNCGERGGEAVADILFGDVNPSGRLPVSVARHVGQLPVYYNHTPSKALKNGYVDEAATPLYPFGHGLSYTTFEYANLRIAPREIGVAGDVTISVEVKNTGRRAGKEVVQLYIDDVISSLTTPVQQLAGFSKIDLEPGEARTVTFTVTSEQLAFLDLQLQPVVEPGEFAVMVGGSSADIRLKGSFHVAAAK